MEEPAKASVSVSIGSQPNDASGGVDFRRVADNIPGCIMVADVRGKAIYANKKFVTALGRPLEEIIGEGWLQSVEPRFIEEAQARWSACIQTNEPLDVTWQFRVHDGTYRWQHLKAEPSGGAEREDTCWYLVGLDVDEQYRAQEALQARMREARTILDPLPESISTHTVDDLYRSRELLREREVQLNLLTETFPAILWKADSAGKVTYINKRAFEYTGRNLEEIQEKGWLDLLHPDDLLDTLALWNSLLAGGNGYDTIHRFFCIDGQYRWFHTATRVVRDEAGNRIAFHGVALDTTPLKAAETALQQSEEQWRRLMDTAPTMIWSMSPDGSALFMNKIARELTGGSLDEVQNGNWIKYIHSEDQESVTRELTRALSTGTSYSAEYRLLIQDGTCRWFLGRAEPCRDDRGNIVRWFGVTVDIHDRKLAEARIQELRTNLSRTSRASIVSEISASIAHELNQPLSSLLSNAQACFRWLNTETTNLENAVISIDRVIRDVRAVDAAIRNIRSLYKQQPTTKASFNMVELLREVIGLLKEDASRRSVPIEYEFEAPVLEVLVDRYQIQQIIINLVTNAIDAMRMIDREPLLWIRIRKYEGGCILTEFIDNGHGLPDNGAEKIFDAFLSTKENGMGIGLAISRSIVEAHQGQLWAANNTGFGATFSLLLKGPDVARISTLV